MNSPNGRRPFSFRLAELSGALGDLGTFVPLVVTLVAVCDLDLGSVLLFAGICNILTGLMFRQPVPVQPMKAIAAVAIAEGLAPGTIAAAGLGTGLIILLLAVTGLVEAAERRIPRAVVRGIQLGVGLKLFLKGATMLFAAPWSAWEGPGVGLAAAALVLLAMRKEKLPSALLLFAGGLVLMLFFRAETFQALAWGWGGVAVKVPTAGEWQVGLLNGTLPQVPLTLLNSVIAVCALSGELFPGKAIGTRAMATSVGLMNLVGCWFGAMPMCHGSGGLAGQYRFGARTGGSVIFLGAAKVAVAVLLGSSAMVVLAAYPANILGVLLLFAGFELARPVARCRGTSEISMALVTGAGCVVINTSIGFLLGIAAAVLFSLRSPDRTA